MTDTERLDWLEKQRYNMTGHWSEEGWCNPTAEWHIVHSMRDGTYDFPKKLAQMTLRQVIDMMRLRGYDYRHAQRCPNDKPQKQAEALARECAQRVCIFPSTDYKALLDSLPLTELLACSNALEQCQGAIYGYKSSNHLHPDSVLARAHNAAKESLAALRAKLPKEAQ